MIQTSEHVHEMRVNKWWQNVKFWINFSFKTVIVRKIIDIWYYVRNTKTLTTLYFFRRWGKLGSWEWHKLYYVIYSRTTNNELRNFKSLNSSALGRFQFELSFSTLFPKNPCQSILQKDRTVPHMHTLPCHCNGVTMPVKNEPQWGGQCRGHPFALPPHFPSPQYLSLSGSFPPFIFFSPSPLFPLPGTGPQVSTAAPEPAHTPPGPQVLQDTGCGNNVTGVLPPCLQKIRFCGLFIWGEGGLSQTSCFKKLAWVL